MGALRNIRFITILALCTSISCSRENELPQSAVPTGVESSKQAAPPEMETQIVTYAAGEREEKEKHINQLCEEGWRIRDTKQSASSGEYSHVYITVVLERAKKK